MATSAEKSPRRRRRTGVAVMAAVAVLGGGRYAERPDPQVRDVAPGHRYELMLIDEPRRLVVHVYRADLTRSQVVVTPPVSEEGLPLRAQTTTAFARAHELDVAINGDFFAPWHSYHPFDFYPRAGDPVGPKGLAVGNGVMYGGAWVPGDTLFFSCEGAASERRPAEPCAAISGQRILRDGAPVEPHRSWRHPRTALCWETQRLTLVVVDGRQPGYSGGMRRGELTDLLVDLGCRDALNLDGGGSTTMALRTERGIEAVNRPIHTRVLGRERPIANHLGLRIKR